MTQGHNTFVVLVTFFLSTEDIIGVAFTTSSPVSADHVDLAADSSAHCGPTLRDPAE